MNSGILDLLFGYFLKAEKPHSENEKRLYHEILQYVVKEHSDEAEAALNCYGGVCQEKAFKQGFITAYELFKELNKIA